MLAVPAATPVTKPVFETVATDVFEETHALVVAAVPDPVNWEVPPTHNEVVPVTVGLVLTVTVEIAEHPLLLV